MDFSDSPPLLLPVVRLVLLARKRTLLTFEAFSLVGEVKTSDGASVRILDEGENAEVDPNRVFRLNVS